MKIIFFGSSDFSIPILQELLNAKYPVVQVVTTPDRKKGRGQKVASSTVKTFALEHRLPFCDPEKLSNPEVAEKLKCLDPDILIIASYGKLIPSSIFTLPKIAALNVHPSLLPRHRGASPIQAAILAGDSKTGVSIAEVIKELDAGDLFAQIETPLGKNENSEELGKRLAQLAIELLLKLLTDLKQGKVQKRPQDSQKATYAKKLERESGHIHWDQPASDIHNQVRAYYPWPSAFSFFDGKRVKILETKNPKLSSREALPGTVLEIEKEKAIYVQTQTGPIALIRVQPEAGREMSAYQFAIGKRIQKGQRFQSL